MWGGGRNLSGEYFEGRAGAPAWVDLSFDLSGPLVAGAAAQFDADWAFASALSSGDAFPVAALRAEVESPNDGGGDAVSPAGVADTRALPVRPGAQDDAMPVGQLIASGPDFADDTVHALLLTSCYRARDRITIVTPYLVPDESLLTALTLAARRGVLVDIVLPARSNHRLADIARQRPMRDLANAGARLWLTSAMAHAKAVVVDRHIALVGSVNLDSRSLFLNFELMTAFYVPSEIELFARWIDALFETAQPYVPRHPSLARHIGEGLVLWLAFQL